MKTLDVVFEWIIIITIIIIIIFISLFKCWR